MKKAKTAAPFRAEHRRAYKRFASQPQREREELLIRMGILTKDGQLASRYGGSKKVKPKVKGRVARAAESSG